eukprot:797577_1
MSDDHPNQPTKNTNTNHRAHEIVGRFRNMCFIFLLLLALTKSSESDSFIATGSFQTCVFHNNKTKCFGSNMYGQLGLGDRNNRGDEANEMGDNNEVKCWGYNLHGQLGYGDTNNRGDLSEIDLGSSFIPKQITGGDSHTCALSTHNKVKCWGYNLWGALGTGDTNNRGDAANEMGESLLEIDLGTG